MAWLPRRSDRKKYEVWDETDLTGNRNKLRINQPYEVDISVKRELIDLNLERMGVVRQSNRTSRILLRYAMGIPRPEQQQEEFHSASS